MSSPFKVAVLASGSKGNATIISAGDQTFLIDAGISCKQIVQRMDKAGFKPEDLCGVLLTHEHIDHVAGLPVFNRKYKLPIFANEATWRNFSKRHELDRTSCRLLPRQMVSGGMKVTSFAVPHDAAATVGYVFEYADTRCVYLTDVGFITDEVKQATDVSDVMILEANHDIDMLKNGVYPYQLKQRILGTRGHLSNVAAGWLLKQVAHRPKEVFLAHLSQENNLPSLAYKTVCEAAEVGEGTDCVVYVASQENIVQNYL